MFINLTDENGKSLMHEGKPIFIEVLHIKPAVTVNTLLESGELIGYTQGDDFYNHGFNSQPHFQVNFKSGPSSSVDPKGYITQGSDWLALYEMMFPGARRGT